MSNPFFHLICTSKRNFEFAARYTLASLASQILVFTYSDFRHINRLQNKL